MAEKGESAKNLKGQFKFLQNSVLCSDIYSNLPFWLSTLFLSFSTNLTRIEENQYTGFLKIYTWCIDSLDVELMHFNLSY